MISDSRIDGGKAFDWGRVSGEYARFRDIYPPEFYEKIHSLGLCTRGQKVLDIGTGTGVLPRNMYRYGACFTGTDISENQIKAARELSKGMDISYKVCSAEDSDFPPESFDVITACQCYFYFKPDVFAPKAAKMLVSGGKMAFLYMAWLPYDDEIAGESERLILKYNPAWSGAGETRHDIFIDPAYDEFFTREELIRFDADVPFTRESWNGRIKACRGVGASLSEEEIIRFEAEHMAMLEKYPESFTVKHYCAFAVMRKI